MCTSLCLAPCSCPSKLNSDVSKWFCQLLPALCPVCPTFSPIISPDGRILKSLNRNQVQFSDWVGWGGAIPKPLVPWYHGLYHCCSFNHMANSVRQYNLKYMHPVHSSYLSQCFRHIAQLSLFAASGTEKMNGLQRRNYRSLLNFFLSRFLWFLMNITHCLPRTLSYEFRWRWKWMSTWIIMESTTKPSCLTDADTWFLKS